MSKIKNVARQVIFRQLKGSKVQEINRDPKHSFCMICKHSLGDDKIKRKFGSFCRSCGVAAMAIMGEVGVQGEFNYLQFYW